MSTGDRPTAPQLLLLGHAADRSGPPAFTLHLLRWLRRTRPDVAVEVVLLAGGDLLEAMREVAPVTVFAHPDLSQDDRTLVHRGQVDADALWARARAVALRELMAPYAEARVAYVSCAPAIELAQALPAPPEVLLCHVHEMRIGLLHRMRPLDRHLFLVGATRLFAVSDAVTAELVDTFGRDPAAIERQPEMIDVDAAVALGAHEDADAARRERGIDPARLVVGACGSIEPRKGTDLFLRLAWHLRRADLDRPVSLVWIGGDPDGIAVAEARAAQLGVSDVVRFVGSQPDPPAWFSLLDVLVLPSREDPFPLVCLEALAVGTPVVAFDEGGIPELLRQGCGEVVAYPDVAAMAGAVAELLGDPARAAAQGDRGRRLVREQHDVSVVAPQLWRAVEEHL